ncbi:hypothetical protein, partial [Bacteroides xylanisolvens]
AFILSQDQTLHCKSIFSSVKMIFCSVQDAVNLLTLFKYLSSSIVSLLSRTSIDGSIFFTCTTCIAYQYFKELAAFVSKADAKVKALFLTTKLFRKFFFIFFFLLISQALYAKGKECIKEKQRPFSLRIGLQR